MGIELNSVSNIIDFKFRQPTLLTLQTSFNSSSKFLDLKVKILKLRRGIFQNFQSRQKRNVWVNKVKIINIGKDDLR